MTARIPAAAGASIDSIIAEAEGSGVRVGFYARTPDGTRVAHRANEVFMSASTIKIAILIELFRRIEAGELDLDQRYVLQESDRVAGSGVLQHMSRGLDLPLRDLCYLMMSISDNLATNILIGHVGIEAVNAAMQALGLRNSILGRPMEGRPAIAGEQENLTTPAELAHLVECILDGTAAIADSCRAMTGMMELQQNGRRIGRFVPEGTVWGSKTGGYATVVNDVGYVRTRTGPMVIAAFTERVPDVVGGEVLISEIVQALLSGYAR